jgi:hypothetical protein
MDTIYEYFIFVLYHLIVEICETFKLTVELHNFIFDFNDSVPDLISNELSHITDFSTFVIAFPEIVFDFANIIYTTSVIYFFDLLSTVKYGKNTNILFNTYVTINIHAHTLQ